MDRPAAHLGSAIAIATGMLAAFGVKLLGGDPHWVHVVLWVAIAIAGMPLLISLVQQVLKGNFGVDVLAMLSIVTALILGQVWVAAIVVLMLAGGQALESYATRRASSVLNALAKRMPQVAHRVEGEIVDVPVESIAVGDLLILYPHEICPVDGVV
ncbi:MAG: heavy metal translocating P-type ATPase, partial [Edaphobacter sp.]